MLLEARPVKGSPENLRSINAKEGIEREKSDLLLIVPTHGKHVYGTCRDLREVGVEEGSGVGEGDRKLDSE